MAWQSVLGVTSKPSYHRGFRRDPTALCGDLECGTRQSRPWPSPSMGARIARSENLDKAPEGAGWEDSYASRARSDGRFAQTSLLTSLRPGADGDHPRHPPRILLSAARRADETVWRCLHQDDQNADRPDHLLHRRSWYRWNGGPQASRSRRHQGVDLFRGGDDARAHRRPCHRQHSATRRWHEC